MFYCLQSLSFVKIQKQTEIWIYSNLITDYIALNYNQINQKKYISAYDSQLRYFSFPLPLADTVGQMQTQKTCLHQTRSLHRLLIKQWILDYKLMKAQTFFIVTLFFSLTHSYDPTIMSTCVWSCAANCKTCFGASCVECKLGYSLNSNSNTCTAHSCSVMSGCATCNANATFCYSCTDPYSIVSASGNACIQSCPLRNCAKCIAASSSCTTWNTGYTLYSLTNQCIVSTIADCLVAYDFRGKQFQCTLCKSGFKPSPDQTLCLPSTCTTIDNCLTCAVPTVCTLCRDGFSVNAGNCQPNACVVSNCLQCDNAGACQKCVSTYTLSGDQCIKNRCFLPNCATCKPGSIYCDQCSTGFTLNIWSKNCDITLVNPSTNPQTLPPTNSTSQTNQLTTGSSSNIQTISSISKPSGIVILPNSSSFASAPSQPLPTSNASSSPVFVPQAFDAVASLPPFEQSQVFGK